MQELKGDPQIDIAYIGGNCPVQSEGEIGDKLFYFRARHEHWSLGIGGDPVLYPEWYHEEEWGEGPHDAGWMPQHVALAMMAKAFALYGEQTAKL